ncbi:MAG: YkgJ family cysteine cluster protein [Desulfobacterales bacterium]|nr:YkgJ family cysteine cluster protein [Desulfobacterales bacterium]
MTIPVRKTDLKRNSIFGYTCNRCLGCCRFKKIQLNPYEIARLARNRGLSTTDFIARHTTNGGTVLRFQEDGTCGFLDAQGCSVHPDRPLVCRLYPLGRHVHFLGVEHFNQMECESGCQGIFHENGTIERYLTEQGAGPFMHAADLYLDLLRRLLEALQDQELEPAQSENVLETVRTVTERPEGGHDLSWIDMDRALSDYCAQSGLPVPADIEAKMTLHIKAVRAWAA